MDGSVKPYDVKPYPSLMTEPPFSLPDETLDDLDLTPIEFREAAEMITESMAAWYGVCVRANRLSKGYLDSVFQMIAVMKQAAGCCITKAVLEQDGESFPSLEHLDIDTMYSTASSLFRKTHDAAMHYLKNGHSCSGRALAAEMALFDLLRRLQATSERITKIREKHIGSEKILAMRQGHPAPSKGKRDSSPSAANPVKKAVSFPVRSRFLKKTADNGSAEKPAPLPPSVPGTLFSNVIPQPLSLSELAGVPIRTDLPAEEMPFPDLFTVPAETEKVPAAAGTKKDRPGRFRQKKRKRR